MANKIRLTTQVKDVLPVANGGSGSSTEKYAQLVGGNTFSGNGLQTFEGSAGNFLIDGTGAYLKFTRDSNNYIETTGVNSSLWLGTGGGSQNFGILANGNVGIGTTAPGNKLHINGIDGDDTVSISSPLNAAGAVTGISFRYGGSGAGNKIARIIGYTQSGGGGDLKFQSSENGAAAWDTKMIIEKSGNVGIGTTSPGSKLSIVGLPTSSSGLSAGDIWNNNGVLNII